MLTGIQTSPKLLLPLGSLEWNLSLTDQIPSISQLSDNSEPIQTRTAAHVVSSSYPESDYHWLVEVLDELIEFMHCDESLSVPELAENDYDWAHTLLVELVGTVGESDTHPLYPLMEFVCRLIDNYEEKYVPKLTELFPELTQESYTETTTDDRQFDVDTPKLSENELAAHAFFTTGFLLYHGNQLEKALSAYDNAIALKPDFVEAYNNRGGVKNLLGKHQNALADYNKAIRLKPDYAEAYSNRGGTKNLLGKHQEALADYDKAIQLKSDNPKVYDNRGSTKHLLRKHQEAIIDYDKAIRLKPDYVEAYRHRGNVNRALGKYEAAFADYDKVINLRPHYAEAYDLRGSVQFRLERYTEAISDYSKVIQLIKSGEMETSRNQEGSISLTLKKNTNFGEAEAYYNRGSAKSKLGDFAEAILDYDKVIQLKPDDAEAYHNRGQAKIQLKQPDDALIDFDEAIRIKPDYVDAYANRGRAKIHLNQPNEALTDLNKAIRIKPDYADAYANRGVAKTNLGINNKAKSDFQKALELAEQQGNNDLKTFVEAQLQQLNDSKPQDNEN